MYCGINIVRSETSEQARLFLSLTMFIIIDNTEDNRITFSTWLNKKFVQKIFTVERNQELLVYLDKWLNGLKQVPTDIEAIGVVVGAGKFTGTRLAVTLANTLAFSLQIPVITLNKDYTQEKAYTVLGAAKNGTYIMPIYSGEARIGN